MGLAEVLSTGEADRGRRPRARDLWFDGATEFLRATEAALTPPVSELGRQSERSVAERCRPSEGFVDGVHSSWPGVVDLLRAAFTDCGSVADPRSF